jgi:hypothetical protein
MHVDTAASCVFTAFTKGLESTHRTPVSCSAGDLFPRCRVFSHSFRKIYIFFKINRLHEKIRWRRTPVRQTFDSSDASSRFLADWRAS